MKRINEKQVFIMEYKEFSENTTLPPTELEQKVMRSIYSLMNPNGWMVFSKLSLLHLISGIITLTFCPQFGVNVLGFEYGLTRFLFKLGPYGCTFFCGGIFIGITLLIASAFLTHEEIIKIKKYWVLQISSLSLLSLGAFIMLDAEILVSFGFAWMSGALIGGVSMLETGHLFKKKTSILHSL